MTPLSALLTSLIQRHLGPAESWPAPWQDLARDLQTACLEQDAKNASLGCGEPPARLAGPPTLSLDLPEARARVDDPGLVAERPACSVPDPVVPQNEPAARRLEAAVPISLAERRLAEDRLLRGEERLRAAVEISGIGIFEHDHRTDHLHWSMEMRRIHGWSPDEPATLQTTMDSVHPDDRERVGNAIRLGQDPRGDGRHEIEHRIVRRDGSVRWLVRRARTFFEGEGDHRRPLRTVGAVLDLTAERRTAEAVKEGEKRLRLALAAANQGLYDLNVQTGVAIVSPEYALMLGYDPNTFQETNERWRERLHPDDREATSRAYFEYIAGRSSEYRVEFRQLTRSGAWKWILSLGKVVAWDEAGQPLRMLGTHTDITDRKRMEEVLSLTLERFSLAMEAANDGLSDWFCLADTSYFSPRCYTMLGYEAGPASARIETWLNLIHPEDRHVSQTRFEDCLRSEKGTCEIEFRVLRRDGAYAWILSRGKVVQRDPQGQPLRLVGIHSDVTERRQAQGRLAQVLNELELKVQERTGELTLAKEEAESASRAKSEFLAMMSHEIRTPLSGVIGVLRIIGREGLSPKQLRHLEIASTSAETLLEIINDILDFSKVEAGKLDLESVAFDLHHTLQNIAGLFEARATAKGLALTISFDPSVPRWVRGDSLRIGQILLNLVGNAIKFTESGRIDVRILAQPGLVGRTVVRVVVSDTGIGIPAERQGRIFQPFYQVDSSARRRYGGTGLGLGISRQLATLMGGTLGLESEPGRGSTFWFEVPFEDAEAPHPESHTPMKPVLEMPGAKSPPPLTRSRVLLAEDNDINQELAREMIEAAGCLCDCVGNGRAAASAVHSGGYDLVLMDCMMPEMDGYEASRAIRAEEALQAAAGGPARRIPIIALTANAMKGDRERCLAAGMDDYLTKPLEPDAVVERVRYWIARATGLGHIAGISDITESGRPSP